MTVKEVMSKTELGSNAISSPIAFESPFFCPLGAFNRYNNLPVYLSA